MTPDNAHRFVELLYARDRRAIEMLVRYARSSSNLLQCDLGEAERATLDAYVHAPGFEDLPAGYYVNLTFLSALKDRVRGQNCVLIDRTVTAQS